MNFQVIVTNSRLQTILRENLFLFFQLLNFHFFLCIDPRTFVEFHVDAFEIYKSTVKCNRDSLNTYWAYDKELKHNMRVHKLSRVRQEEQLIAKNNLQNHCFKSVAEALRL